MRGGIEKEEIRGEEEGGRGWGVEREREREREKERI